MGRPLAGINALPQARLDAATATTADELRRAQTVLLPHDHGLSLMQVAQALGRSPGWISRQRRQYLMHGRSGENKERGGRRNQLLTPEDETSIVRDVLLQQRYPFDYGVQVKKRVEQKVGRAIAVSTVYKMINRVIDQISPGATADDMYRISHLLNRKVAPKL